jgi:hypothetical protein
MAQKFGKLLNAYHHGSLADATTAGRPGDLGGTHGLGVV